MSGHVETEETSKYTEPVKDKIRQFSFEIDARSIITFPAYPVQLEKGWVEIRGGYHLNPITAWRIRRDGAVLFKPENWKQ